MKAVCFTRTKALQQQRTAIRDNTKESYGNRIYDHIIPDIGKILLCKLTQNDLQQFYARLKKKRQKAVC